MKTWLAATLHTLKHGSPDEVLQLLRERQHELEGGTASPETRVRVQTAINYLDKRRAQMEYARFQAAGYPIGSGSVESGNKVVVEARLKGAGMHWAREHVNPLVALRNMLCSARWDQDRPQIATRVRAQHLQARQQRQRTRWSQRQARTRVRAQPTPIPPARAEPATPELVPVTPTTRKTGAAPKTKQPYRPPAKHPWRHSPIGRARFKPYRSGLDPKI